MTPEDARFHAACARRLIRACGGLAEAASACRLEKSRLHDFTVVDLAAPMPVDVILDLQTHCGKPVYSEALTARLPGACGCGGAREEACAFTETAAALQAEVRLALADGRLTPREKAELTLLLTAAEMRLRSLRMAAERGQP